jgi:hypothetical protein
MEDKIEEKELINTFKDTKVDFKNYTFEDYKKLGNSICDWIDKSVPAIDSNEPEALAKQFQLDSRKFIIFDKLETAYLIRIEEIWSNIKNIQDKLEEHSKKSDEEVKRMLNVDLMEINNMRSILPNLFVELESLPMAICYTNLERGTAIRNLNETQAAIKMVFNDEEEYKKLKDNGTEDK